MLNGPVGKSAFRGKHQLRRRPKLPTARQPTWRITTPTSRQLPKASLYSCRPATRTAASADNGNVSTHGISVSGFTSTPYNVSVGGTDFGYTADTIDPSDLLEFNQHQYLQFGAFLHPGDPVERFLCRKPASKLPEHHSRGLSATTRRSQPGDGSLHFLSERSRRQRRPQRLRDGRALQREPRCQRHLCRVRQAVRFKQASSAIPMTAFAISPTSLFCFERFLGRILCDLLVKSRYQSRQWAGGSPATAHPAPGLVSAERLFLRRSWPAFRRWSTRRPMLSLG